MRIVDDAAVAAALDYPALIDRLRDAFVGDAVVPVRHHHTVAVPGKADATLLLMPAWAVGEVVGIKIVTVFPDNAQVSLPAVFGSYLVLSGQTGQPLAMMDGRTLTVRRTAAASALAATYLARKDADSLLMVGTGALAPQLIAAHRAVRPIRRVAIWGRDPAKAAELAKTLEGEVEANVATDLATAVGEAAIVSCATLSHDPLVKGEWLSPGSHLDLVGGFTPQMRETDDASIRRASVFVDTRAGATKEAGDITQALASGALKVEDIRAELAELAKGSHPGRGSDAEITLFKSVGTAIEDLAAARLVLDRLPAA